MRPEKNVHDPSTFGMSADLYGQGYVGADAVARRQNSARLFDVRRPTTIEGWGSYDWTLYANAFYRGGPEDIPAAEPLPDHVVADLEIGNGGVTRTERFEFPAVGKSLHLVADSIRMNVSLKRPEADGEWWHVVAGVAIGGLYPGMVRRRVSLVATESEGEITPGESAPIEIPFYAEAMRFRAVNLGAVEYRFLYQGPSTAPLFPYASAVQHQDWLFLPLPAAYVQISSAVTQDVEIAFKRPS
jgi:hypothetical protein